jgi:hypothetical protein
MTKPASPPPKPKLTAEERRAKTTARLWATRLRVTVDRELENRGITDPKAIGEAIGLPALEAIKLLTRLQWREGDVALLQAAADRLGLQVLKLDPWQP